MNSKRILSPESAKHTHYNFHSTEVHKLNIHNNFKAISAADNDASFNLRA